VEKLQTWPHQASRRRRQDVVRKVVMEMWQKHLKEPRIEHQGSQRIDCADCAESPPSSPEIWDATHRSIQANPNSKACVIRVAHGNRSSHRIMQPVKPQPRNSYHRIAIGFVTRACRNMPMHQPYQAPNKRIGQTPNRKRRWAPTQSTSPSGDCFVEPKPHTLPAPDGTPSKPRKCHSFVMWFHCPPSRLQEEITCFQGGPCTQLHPGYSHLEPPRMVISIQKRKLLFQQNWDTWQLPICVQLTTVVLISFNFIFGDIWLR
jgi:hypothetical protein